VISLGAPDRRRSPEPSVSNPGGILGQSLRDGVTRFFTRFCGQSPTFRGRKSGTDARFPSEVREFDGVLGNVRLSLDQESPGSIPGGAIQSENRTKTGRHRTARSSLVSAYCHHRQRRLTRIRTTVSARLKARSRTQSRSTRARRRRPVRPFHTGMTRQFGPPIQAQGAGRLGLPDLVSFLVTFSRRVAVSGRSGCGTDVRSPLCNPGRCRANTRCRLEPDPPRAGRPVDLPLNLQCRAA